MVNVKIADISVNNSDNNTVNKKRDIILLFDIENQTIINSNKNVLLYFLQSINLNFNITHIYGFGNLSYSDEFLKYIDQKEFILQSDFLIKLNEFLDKNKSIKLNFNWEIVKNIFENACFCFQKQPNIEIKLFSNQIGKNNADNNLIRELNKIIQAWQKPNNIILISADGDFLKILLKARQNDIEPLIINFNDTKISSDIKDNKILEKNFFNILRITKKQGKKRYKNFLKQFTLTEPIMPNSSIVPIIKSTNKKLKNILNTTENNNLKDTETLNNSHETLNNLNETLNNLNENINNSNENIEKNMENNEIDILENNVITNQNKEIYNFDKNYIFLYKEFLNILLNNTNKEQIIEFIQWNLKNNDYKKDIQNQFSTIITYFIKENLFKNFENIQKVN